MQDSDNVKAYVGGISADAYRNGPITSPHQSFLDEVEQLISSIQDFLCDAGARCADLGFHQPPQPINSVGEKLASEPSRKDAILQRLHSAKYRAQQLRDQVQQIG